jgi:hypothetical protein
MIWHESLNVLSSLEDGGKVWNRHSEKKATWKNFFNKRCKFMIKSCDITWKIKILFDEIN